jgi:uncharacterized protein (TIGR02001 family)
VWLAAIGLAGVPAHAAESWGGALLLTNDYVFRGVSQTDHGAAAQADVHVRSAQGWFAGVWSSTANPPPGYIASYEVNVYAGRGWALSDRWAASVRYVRYLYPNSPAHGRYDSDEVAATLNFEDRIAMTVAYTPNATRYSNSGWAFRRRALAYEAALRQHVVGPVSVLAAVGYYDTHALFGASYWAWSAGLSAQAGPVELTLARFGVDAHGRRLFDADAADGRWVLSAAWRF